MNRGFREVDYSVVEGRSFRGVSGAMHNVDLMITSKVPKRKIIASVYLEDDVEVNDLISLYGIAIDLQADVKILGSGFKISADCEAFSKELHIPVIIGKDMTQIKEKILELDKLTIH